MTAMFVEYLFLCLEGKKKIKKKNHSSVNKIVLKLKIQFEVLHS